MVYYKIPVSSGVFDYPAGCILCCAYTYSGYMYCKFESVTAVGNNWVEITESEFDARCPEFQAPDLPPVQEAIVTSATLSGGSIVLELSRQVDTGTLVKFEAPCACSAVTGGIVIDGTTYSVVDALGKAVTGSAGAWDAGAQLAVIVDNDDKKAYIQNAGTSSYLKEQLAAKQNTITGAASTIAGSNLTKNRALVSNGSGKVVASNVTDTELGFLDGVKSNIQDQLDGKQSSITLTGSRVLVSNANGKVAASSVTSAELGHLGGVTSAIQPQLNGKAASGNAATVTALSVSGTFENTNTATIANASGYKLFVILAKMDVTGEPYACCVIPKAMLGTSASAAKTFCVWGRNSDFACSDINNSLGVVNLSLNF